jgi:hypothetical protein
MCLLCKKWKDEFKMFALISLLLEIINFVLFIRELNKKNWHSRLENTHEVTERRP